MGTEDPAETARLAELDHYKILDTLEEQTYEVMEKLEKRRRALAISPTNPSVPQSD